jgi:hypothetical protein
MGQYEDSHTISKKYQQEHFTTGLMNWQPCLQYSMRPKIQEIRSSFISRATVQIYSVEFDKIEALENIQTYSPYTIRKP